MRGYERRKNYVKITEDAKTMKDEKTMRTTKIMRSKSMEAMMDKTECSDE